MNNNDQSLDISNSYKQILYDIDHNKYYLKYENDKTLYNSNIFGMKTPKQYSSNIIISAYKDRILSNSMDKINFKVDNSLYHPQTNRFEGYTQFPRPLVVPFTNIAQPETRKYLYETMLKIKNDFVIQKNKDIFTKKLNRGLHYYTGTIHNLSDNKNKNLFLKKINECLQKEEEAKNMDKQQSMEEREIRALKNIKKKLVSNSTNVIFGRKLKPPNKKFIQKFKINYNVYFRNPIEKLKEIKTEKKDYFKDLYKILNKDEVKQFLNSTNNKATNVRRINKSINKSIQPKIKNIRYILSGHKLLNNRNQTKETKETVLNDENTNIENSIEQSKDLLDNINLIEKDYIKELSNQKNNFFSTIEKNCKNNYEHLISKENEPNKIKSYSLDNKSKVNDGYENIHPISNFYRNFKLEKKLLTGYIQPIIKEEIKIRKGILKYKSFIDTYKKEIELYKKVNPIRCKINEEKEEKELKYLLKKLEKARELNPANFKNVNIK